MLQQTRVETALPYYDEFLRRFPTTRVLAAASEEDVLAAWSGLGYYRRARSLLAGARAVMERHAGRVPDRVSELRALPGIGRYTAGAIASIAFDLPEPILDGNVKRVLCRLNAMDGSGSASKLWRMAGELARGPDPGSLNQALMELGALVCTPRKPDCPRCPIRSFCDARGAGDPTGYPAAVVRRPTEFVRVAVACIQRNGRALLEHPGDDSPLRGTWDLPAVEFPDATDPRSAIERRLRQLGLRVRARSTPIRLSHGILHRRLRLEVLDCRISRGRVAGRDDLRWIDRSEIGRTAISGATRKVLLAVDEQPAST
jgi:A/G-specific adenine glycosylase